MTQGNFIYSFSPSLYFFPPVLQPLFPLLSVTTCLQWTSWTVANLDFPPFHHENSFGLSFPDLRACLIPGSRTENKNRVNL